jgi:GT2 family glycosyltransferase
MVEPLVSVVVVTLNNISLLRDCLASLMAQSHKNLELILVDNGSTEDVEKFARTEFPSVIYIRLPQNAGFAGGNNVGIASAKGEYVALINNDAVASKDWIKTMVDAVLSDDRAGQVASVIIDGNAPDILDSCGLGIALDGMSRQAQKGELPPKLSAPEEVLMASGCACLFRSAALKEVGLFDPDFFAYCEDADLGLRLRRAGWVAVVAPGALVSHHYSMTMGRYSLKKVYFVERNHYWVAVKNFPFFLLFLVPFVSAWRFLLQASMLFSGKKGVAGFFENATVAEIAKVYLSAYVDMVVGLPSMFKKRFQTTRAKKGGLEMMRLLLKHRLPMRKILGG